jgi:hypothetical protein
MNISDRLLEYLEFKGVTKNKFYVNLGLSNGFLDKKSNIGADKIERIIEYYPDINLYWLILGTGPMLRASGNKNEIFSGVLPSGPCSQCELRDMVIKQQSKTIALLEDKINGAESGNSRDVRQTG